MKSYKQLVFALLVSSAIIVTCQKLEKLMRVSTGVVSNIHTTTADVSGEILDLGEGATLYGHCYSTTPNPTIASDTTKNGIPSVVGPFTSNIKDLDPGTKYYVKAYLSDGIRTAYGAEKSFLTVSAALPTLTTKLITNITTTHAYSGGDISSDGGVPIFIFGVCWSTSPNPTTLNSATYQSNNSGTFTSIISHLTIGVTYYVRAYATNFVGTAYGNEISFTTAIGVGETHQGGIIAYVLQPGDPGYIAGQIHGLIASPPEQIMYAAWGCPGSSLSGADGTILGTGSQNTIDIVNGCNNAGIAARLCSDLYFNGYSDWYLPSKDELNKLYLNKDAIGYNTGNFWSSSEENSNAAWYQSFFDGTQASYEKNYNSYVRPIRTF